MTKFVGMKENTAKQFKATLPARAECLKCGAINLIESDDDLFRNRYSDTSLWYDCANCGDDRPFRQSLSIPNALLMNYKKQGPDGFDWFMIFFLGGIIAIFFVGILAAALA